MRCSKRRVSRNGFTLIEIMVVVLIIGLLAGAVTLSVRSYLVRSKQNIAKMEISKLCQAIDTYYAEFDRYPTNEEGLELLAQSSEVFVDGLIKEIPKDPWGHLYAYTSPGTKDPYQIICLGGDGLEGGDGADRDITSENLSKK